MTLLIDIQTPAGKSLEGFPVEEDKSVNAMQVFVKADGECNVTRYIDLWEQERVLNLHPGDTITIKVKD